jgi:hypothetical protein
VVRSWHDEATAVHTSRSCNCEADSGYRLRRGHRQIFRLIAVRHGGVLILLKKLIVEKTTLSPATASDGGFRGTEESLRRGHILARAEHGVDQVYIPVDHAIQIAPSALNLAYADKMKFLYQLDERPGLHRR